MTGFRLVCAAALLGSAALAPAQPTYSLNRVYSSVTFPSGLVHMEEAPDDSGRLFFVIQSGEVRIIPKRSNATNADAVTFIDISSRVLNRGEQGLLGFAFDPGFRDTGIVYLHYTYGENDSSTNPGVTRISRFRVSGAANGSADPASEEILLTVAQPFTNHNGGTIAFGPDQLLYIGLGDGGSSNDPQGNGQNISNLLGKILRIDVRTPPQTPLAYRIPTSNPFAATAGARGEIYAYGIRNPYRFSFDRERGYLMLGDVGQDTQEEIDHVVLGGNYGWKIREGSECRGGGTACTTPPGTTFVEPIAIYRHNGAARSVTGGVVYYGTRNPELHGRYVFADYITGQIWAITYDGTPGLRTPQQLIDSTLNPAGFGQTLDGEVLILNYGGTVWQLAPTLPTGWQSE